jgi:hypothetical protein
MRRNPNGFQLAAATHTAPQLGNIATDRRLLHQLGVYPCVCPVSVLPE